MYKSLLNRYIWLIDTILQAKKITFKEINEKWKRSQLNITGESLPTRTFHNHRSQIEKLFDVNIECKSNQYYIENEEDITTNKVRNWLLNTFTVNNMLKERKNLMHRILLEDIPSGREHLNLLMDAMQTNKILKINYQSFFKDNITSFYFAPYCLKLFKQRWYIVGLHKEHNEIRIYSLDRIKELVITNTIFNYPDDFAPEEYFKYSSGIFADHSIKMQKVSIKAYGVKRKYLQALPLHHSQKEIKNTDNYSIFEYKVRPTYDFRQTLLSHGVEIEVVSPESFRNEIKDIVRRMYNSYK